MAMTDAALRAAKPSDKQYKMYDSAGLFVIVRPSGQKLWRFKYRLGLSEQQMSLGTYPLVSLKDARLKRDDLRRKLLDGVDPAGERRKAELAARMAAGNTFGAVARELLDKLEMEGCAKAMQIRNERFFKQLEPDLGRRAVIDFEPVEILSVWKKFERRGIYETAKRLRSFIARVYRYAIVTGRARQNPASDLGEALIKPKKKHLDHGRAAR
ncbi:MAG: tyrosine-type recombinase/integrase [Asticcacaulis sp.]|uniref:tyrosine-type recombinase/integrase n=1 Tax=Asticcacaulis sp. TaxID=1872648 RepID=UPI003F7C90F9